MKPYYEDTKAGITIYNGDCREILPSLPPVDLVLTDPPYGINWIPRVNNREFMKGDNEDFDPSEYLRVGSKHLFWGANYFANKLPPSKSWFVWLKRPDSFDSCKKTYAPCEMAWSNFDGSIRVKHHTWDGNFRSGVENEKFIHPAQKPIEVMRWCIEESDIDGIILDPFMGSGTTLVAAYSLGRKAIGIEIEKKYCDIAIQRLRQMPLPLIESNSHDIITPTQEELFNGAFTNKRNKREDIEGKQRPEDDTLPKETAK